MDLRNQIKPLVWNIVANEYMYLHMAIVGRYKFIIDKTNGELELTMQYKDTVVKREKVESVQKGKALAKYWLIGEALLLLRR